MCGRKTEKEIKRERENSIHIKSILYMYVHYLCIYSCIHTVQHGMAWDTQHGMAHTIFICKLFCFFICHIALQGKQTACKELESMTNISSA